MIELEYEMTYAEDIDGPLGPTAGSPLGERLCWQVVSATLRGPRINASLAMPGTDWMRLGLDGVRRPDLRVQLMTDDGELILFRYVAKGGGGEWTEPGYEQWINHVWMPALERVGLAYQRPYDLRHSFASLLFHEGRSVIYVSRQLGHSAAVCMRTYGHVIEELDEAPRISAEDAIAAARRGDDVRRLFGRSE